MRGEPEPSSSPEADDKSMTTMPAGVQATICTPRKGSAGETPANTGPMTWSQSPRTSSQWMTQHPRVRLPVCRMWRILSATLRVPVDTGQAA